jgi:hypothetical protein
MAGPGEITRIALPMMFNDASWKVFGDKWPCGRKATVWATIVAANCRSRMVLRLRSPDASLPVAFRASMKF